MTSNRELSLGPLGAAARLLLTKVIMKFSWLNALLATTLLSVVGCERQQTQRIERIERVTEPQTLTFHELHGSTPSGYTLHVHGHIDGAASITASESTPQPISGDVDWRIYHDYFRPSIDIQYSPAKVSAGQLTIELTFH